jgi:hypothetical protein
VFENIRNYDLVSRFAIFFGLSRDIQSIKKFYKENFSFKNKSKTIVLVEAFQVSSNEISIMHFLKAMNEIESIQPVGFAFVDLNWWRRLKMILRFRFSPMRRAGIKKLILINCYDNLDIISRNMSVKIIDEIDTLEHLVNAQLNGVTVGDLIHDHFLRIFKAHTISLDDPRLKELIEKFTYFFQSFNKLLDIYNVRGVLVSHCVYSYGIPVRIALDQNVAVYQVTGESAYLMTKDYPMAYTDFFEYKKKFNELSIVRKSKGLELAQERLQIRFNGAVGIDMPCTTNTAFHTNFDGSARLLGNSNKPKILVALHDFFDAANPFGNNLFSSTYEWLCGLREFSKLVDYEWYLKVNPSSTDANYEVLQSIVENSNGFRLLPVKASHHQIITEGVNCALTIYGTIASEYPFAGVPVINASRNNPHVEYNFSLSPKSRDEYWQTLLNIENLNMRIPKEEILEYYFMHHIYPVKSLLFYDYEKYLKDIGGYNNSMTSRVYRLYLGSENSRDFKELQLAFKVFIQSGNTRLDPKHFTDLNPES